MQQVTERARPARRGVAARQAPGTRVSDELRMWEAGSADMSFRGAVAIASASSEWADDTFVVVPWSAWFVWVRESLDGAENVGELVDFSMGLSWPFQVQCARPQRER
jgi:hypothetical protein